MSDRGWGRTRASARVQPNRGRALTGERPRQFPRPTTQSGPTLVRYWFDDEASLMDDAQSRALAFNVDKRIAEDGRCKIAKRADKVGIG